MNALRAMELTLYFKMVNFMLYEFNLNLKKKKPEEQNMMRLARPLMFHLRPVTLDLGARGEIFNARLRIPMSCHNGCVSQTIEDTHFFKKIEIVPFVFSL